jgi:hypothetical protein
MAVNRAMPRSSAAAARRRRPRAPRRAGTRLWALLHSPALLSGGPADLRDPAVAEDDRFRLGRRQR